LPRRTRHVNPFAKPVCKARLQSPFAKPVCKARLQSPLAKPACKAHLQNPFPWSAHVAAGDAILSPVKAMPSVNSCQKNVQTRGMRGTRKNRSGPESRTGSSGCSQHGLRGDGARDSLAHEGEPRGRKRPSISCKSHTAC
jgi:hypothetical protein